MTGPAISWKKVQRGRDVTWVGIRASLDNRTIVLGLPAEFVGEVLAEATEILKLKGVQAARFQKFVGKVE